MKVFISDQAWSDMLDIGRSIPADNPMRASRFIDELHDSCMSLEDMPHAFMLVPRYADYGIRRRVHGQYLIFYRENGVQVDILRVLHGSRDIDRILLQTRLKPDNRP